MMWDGGTERLSALLFWSYCMGQAIPHVKKNFYQQVLKLGANEASAQELQNALLNECHTKFFDKVMGI
jgi:hypothetical protein